MTTALHAMLDGRVSTDEAPLLEVRDVSKTFVTGSVLSRREVHAVDGVSLTFAGDRPAIVSLVGESGSGKTTLARMILGLTEPNAGCVLYRARDVRHLSGRDHAQFRKEVQAVFQDPYSIYNPFYQIDRVFKMAVRKFHLASNPSDAEAMIHDALRAVDLRPRDVLGRYPHQISGGERQRVMLARLYLIRPRLIVADEPVSMIDAAVRAMFLNILLDFRDKLGISTLFITHNLATANYLGGEIIVLYRGRVAERGNIDQVIATPKHPYAQVLLESVPVADPTRRWQEEVAVIGEEARPLLGRERCLFAERCPHRTDACLESRPLELTLPDGRGVACTLYNVTGE